MKKKVLVVEDTRFFRNLIQTSIQSKLGIEVVCAESLAETKSIVEERKDEFFLSLLDINLPDTREEEIVEYIVEQGMPAVVFTSLFSEDLRERILSNNVIDYVIKDTAASISYITSIVNRINNNRNLKALVVDDSSTANKLMTNLLQQYQLNVLQAKNGIEAQKIIEKNPDIRLVVTDYTMPEMDGFELTKWIRGKFQRDEMAIIGVSTAGNNMLSAKFIKNGANDFLSKPFLQEEFFCRVSQNLDLIESIMNLKQMSTHDFMSGLFNRRFLIDTGQTLHANVRRTTNSLAVAMIDVDHFKRVNDTRGHYAGDEVIKTLARTLQSQVRKSDIVARYGGEEFCILTPNMNPDNVEEFYEKIRKLIESTPTHYEGAEIKVTVSIGVCPVTLDSVEEMIISADKMLYKAKEEGRNRIAIDSTLTPAPAMVPPQKKKA